MASPSEFLKRQAELLSDIEDGEGNHIFTRVIRSPVYDIGMYRKIPASPCAFVEDTGGSLNPYNSRIWRRTFAVHVLISSATDLWGDAAIDDMYKLTDAVQEFYRNSGQDVFLVNDEGETHEWDSEEQIGLFIRTLIFSYELDIDSVIDIGNGPIVDGDEMAYKFVELSAQQIRNLAVDSSLISQLEFEVTDVINSDGKIAFKTDIPSADTAATLNLIGNRPWRIGTSEVGDIAVSGTASHDGQYRVEASVPDGGMLTFVTADAFDSSEDGLSAELEFTKVASNAVKIPDVPLDSIVVGPFICSKGARAETIQLTAAVALFLGSGGISLPAGQTRLDLTDKAFSMAGQAIASVNSESNRDSIYVIVNCNNVSLANLDDLTGLDDGMVGAVVYVVAPETAQ
jgi:hypothetical protein